MSSTTAPKDSFYSDFLGDQIRVQKGNVRFSLIWFIILLLIGIVGTILLYKIVSEIPDILKVGPSVILAAISSFQIKTIIVTRERISAFLSLKIRLDSAQGLPDTQIAAVEQIVIDTIKEVVKR
ncbi:MAG: hypothetical protein D8M58_22280 [Calditrichaeota bacterium]|nr:MAG: hypothetical protein DWQ03_08545 [Calditrichota bacterium]MBL1208142.1 hypothetical protein [Calditrichota bacterium]NOG47980.1 hypothetical protein [Calditrichota bacterium]